MLPRIIRWQRLKLRDRNDVCIYCQYAALHTSSSRQEQPLRTPSTLPKNPIWSYRTRTAEGLIYDQLSGKNISDVPKKEIILHDVDVETMAPFDGSDNGMEDVLEKAYSAGALKIKPELIGIFLSDLSQFGATLNAENLRKTCAKYSISIDSAYTLARLLVRSPGKYDQFVGRQILLLASQLGSAKATLFVVKSATKTDQLKKQEIQPCLKHLEKLVERNPPVIPALVARAKIYEVDEAFEEAEKLYRQALDNVPLKEELSMFARTTKQLLERFKSDDSEANIPGQKITVEEDDTELDYVAARLGLANIQYYHTFDHDEALKNWEVAALEHDDPVAYYNLAWHLEGLAKVQNKDKMDPDDPVGHNWLRFVPYKWYEYMMKAAASVHPEACYKIGLFYMLWHMGYANQIIDDKLRRVLTHSPLMRNPPLHKRIPIFQGRPVPGVNIHSVRGNQSEIVMQWLQAAKTAGCDSAYLPLQFMRLKQSNPVLTDDILVSRILWVAARGDQLMTRYENKYWSADDQQQAIKMYKWLMNAERGLAVVHKARKASPKERTPAEKTILHCLRKMPGAIQRLG